MNDCLVVAPDPEPSVSGSIILLVPLSGQRTGTVTAVGPGRLLDNGHREAMHVAVGDRVAYAGGQEYGDVVLLRQHEVTVVL